jgi:hypothetical protein
VHEKKTLTNTAGVREMKKLTNTEDVRGKKSTERLGFSAVSWQFSSCTP